MKTYLVLSVLGKDKLGLVSELSKAIQESGCTITDSRMTVLGSEFAMLLMVSGNWNSLAKMETALPGLQARLNLTIIAKRTEQRPSQTDLLPYMVEIATLARPGIVYQVTDFFSGRNINIEDLYTGCYSTAHSGTSLFSLSMTVNVPADLHIAELREQFMDFCDDLNLDGTMEPLKR